MPRPDRVLIVDDDAQMREMLSHCLAPLECTITPATTGQEALDLLAEEQFTVMLLDLMLPDLDGLQVLEKARQQRPEMDVIIITGHASLETAVEALRTGAYDYVTKPFHAHTVQSAVGRALEKHRFQVRLTALNRATQAMIATLDLDAVLTLAMAEARTMLEAEATAILLLERPEALLNLAATANVSAGPALGTLIPTDVGIAGWVVENAQPVLAPDVQNDPRFDARIDGLAGAQTRSLLAMPLEYREGTIGVIEAVNRTSGDFDDRDRELLSTLAGSAAIAIENARLYEAERDLRQMVEQSQLQLAQTEKLAATGRLAASLAHEINNPLQAIHNSLQLMLSFQLTPQEQKEYLEIAEEEIERLMGLVSSILEFAHPPQREVHLTKLNQIVGKVLRLAGKYLQHRHIRVESQLADDLPPTMGAADELEQVFINLVLNAVDAMPEGGTLRISSRLCADGRLAVTFADTGHGIAPENVDHIFEPFFSTREDGTGLGLTVSHNVIERHGGEIGVQSDVGDGATFTIWLPAASGQAEATAD